MRPKRKTTPKKNEPRVFEPITERQMLKIHLEAQISGLSTSQVKAMIREAACLELATALSKQEADYIIRRIMGARCKVGLMKPHAPKKPSWIACDTTNLPRLHPMREIREFVFFLGWQPWELEAYLKKHHKITALRDLDRAGANKMAYHLQQMLTGKAPRRGAR